MSPAIPRSIIDVEVMDLNTSKTYVLETRQNKGCHFFDRFPTKNYEVQLRLDWNDVDLSGDPMLDADIYLPGETKPIKGSTSFRAHHTPKQKDASSGLYLYEFVLDGTNLSLQVQFTRQQHMPGKARIVTATQQHVDGNARIAPAQNGQKSNPEFEESFKDTDKGNEDD